MMRILLPLLTLVGCAPAVTAPPRNIPSVAPTAIAPPLLAAHNRERVALGKAPVAWDPALAQAAAAHARQLAREGRLRHSLKTQRPGQGENLWIGTSGAYPIAAMVGSWTSERRQFRRGTFPHNSRTGRWSDVGHYTAIVWPTTRRVGCAIGRSARWEVLVCRYWPSGNVDGIAI